jgi:hypothetical protein
MLVTDQVRRLEDDAVHEDGLAEAVDAVHAVVGVAGLPADGAGRRVVREGG